MIIFEKLQYMHHLRYWFYYIKISLYTNMQTILSDMLKKYESFDEISDNLFQELIRKVGNIIDYESFGMINTILAKHREKIDTNPIAYKVEICKEYIIALDVSLTLCCLYNYSY